MSDYTRILVIQLRQMGDVLMTTPSLKNLREIFPHSKIDFLVEEFSAQILQYNKNIDNVITVPRRSNIVKYFRTVYSLFKKNYDLVIDFMSNPKSAQYTFFSRAETRVGWYSEFRNFPYTIKVIRDNQKEYSAFRKFKLLRPITDEAIKKYPIEFPISEKERIYQKEFFQKYNLSKGDLIIAFFPVSRRKYKIWKPEYSAETADKLISQFKAKIIMIHGPGEEKMIYDVVKHMKNECIYDFKKGTPGGLKALLENCSCFVGNDGGPKHFAVTAGIPTITVYNNIDPASWTYPSEKHIGLYRFSEIDYDYSGFKNLSGYDEITPQVVVDEFQKLMSKLNLI